MPTPIRSLKVPSLPLPVQRLMALSPADSHYFEMVLETLALDAGLVTQLFQLAQSPRFRGRESITDAKRALMRVGPRSFVSDVVGAKLARVFPLSDRRLAEIWAHSAFVACINRDLASRFPSLGVHPEWGFVVGVLHDVGAMAMAFNKPEAYVQILLRHPLDSEALRNAEVAAFGVDHTRLGRAVADEWKLPGDAKEAVVRHHEKAPPTAGDPPVLLLTRLSLSLIGLLGKGPRADESSAAGPPPGAAPAQPAGAGAPPEAHPLLSLEGVSDLAIEDFGPLIEKSAEEARELCRRIGVAVPAWLEWKSDPPLAA